MGALDRYFEMISKDLGAIYPNLKSAAALEAVDLSACDLFDGRLYRYVFIAIVAEGLSTKKQEVSKDFFKLQSWAEAELNAIWEEAGKAGDKDGFFPISISALKDMEDIAPPSMDNLEGSSRTKPKLLPVSSDMLEGIWQEAAAPVDIQDEEEEESAIVPLFDADNEYEWRKEDEKAWMQGKKIDSLHYEEKMELSTGEAQMMEKMKAKSKITEGDQKYLKQYKLKQIQMRIRELAMRARSLGGADQLHNAIIVQEKKGKEDEKNKKETKISAKQQEIMDKNAAAEEQKVKDNDAKQMVEWEKSIEKLSEIVDVEKLQTQLLDMLIGYGPARVVDSFERFPQVAAKFKRRDSQAQLVVKVVNATRKVMKKMQLDKLPEQDKVCKLVLYFICLIMEGFSSYGKVLDGKQVKSLQEGLMAVGFPLTAERLFAQWKEYNKPTEAAPAKDDKSKKGKEEKGKKEDKKKEEKKDDKKDDKKDKKDKKAGKDDAAAAAGEEDLDKFKVSPAKDGDLLWAGVGPDEYAWQLMYMGPYMARTVGNAPDPKNRVKFKPDLWQKNLLDIVDSGESALVVAPTASGKTFIGYYTMDKVLREDHEGVAVYIAPSEALVRQVSAEIFARFQSKSYPSHSQQQLLGVFTRKENFAGGVYEAGRWRTCQVLVTTPHIFEILLVSQAESEWVSRLRWVIFDECHSIGNRHEGKQWERIMQLIPCPFIALSATIADEHHFHNWLDAVSQSKAPNKVHLVQHTERWNDLYKYMYVQNELRPLHPFTCLLEMLVKNRGLSADLALTPQESMQLFQEVQKLLGKNASWDKLRPRDFFQAAREKVARRNAAGEVLRDDKDEVIYDEKDVVFLKKNVAIQYSRTMKETFVKLLQDGTLTHEMFDKLIQLLQAPASLNGLDNKFAPPSRVAAEASKPVDLTALYKSGSYLQADTQFRMFKQLESSDILPAIVFNFSRKELEKMCKGLAQRLKDLQHDKYFGDEEKRYYTEHVIMKKRRDEYQKKKEAYDQAQKANASKKQESQAARKNAEGQDEGRGARKLDVADVSEDAFLPEPDLVVDVADEIDPEFSFHSQKVYGQGQEDIDYILKELKRKKVPAEFIDALKRGIGIHHEGLKNKLKQAVETLFRKGFLKVVFATATLALGINMPCRSTIFCGDSLDLNGLMFRQMSGRAGRRGFDLLGQVIFWDMGFAKVQRLVASEMPSLAGEFNQSPTLVLRLLQEDESRRIQEITTEKPTNPALLKSRFDCFAAAVKIPFIRSTNLLEKQVATFSRFAVELLRKESLLSGNGYTRNLSGMVTHLFEVEPANLILNRILSKGLLHRYLSEQEVIKTNKTTWRTVRLASVLGWFIQRQRLPERPGKYAPTRRRNLPSKDCPQLPPLPNYILEEINNYNKSVFELFQQMAFSVCSTAKKLSEEELTLPLSGRRFPMTFDDRGDPAEGSKFFDAYTKQLIRQKSRTPFSALGGFDDFYRSPHDLSFASRQLLHIDMSQLPMVPPPPGCDFSAGLEPANSYIVDILIHEKMTLLQEDNGLSVAKAYPLVEGFKQFLEMATFAMKEMAPKDDIVVSAFEQLSKDLDPLLKGSKRT